MKLKIKKGDVVQVIAGADKGKSGKVLEVDTVDSRILVEGVNIRKKHVKPSQTNPQGGIVSKEAKIHYSNVMLLDGAGKPTRIAIKKTEKAGKILTARIAKTTKQEIAEPKASGRK